MRVWELIRRLIDYPHGQSVGICIRNKEGNIIFVAGADTIKVVYPTEGTDPVWIEGSIVDEPQQDKGMLK